MVPLLGVATRLDNGPQIRYKVSMATTHSATMFIIRDGEEIEVNVSGTVTPAPANEGGGYYVEDVKAVRVDNGDVVKLTARESERADEQILRQNS